MLEAPSILLPSYSSCRTKVHSTCRADLAASRRAINLPEST